MNRDQDGVCLKLYSDEGPCGVKNMNASVPCRDQVDGVKTAVCRVVRLEHVGVEVYEARIVGTKKAEKKEHRVRVERHMGSYL